MAFVPGKSSHIAIDGTTISAYTDEETLQKVKDLAEVTVFGNNDKVYVDGLREWTFTMKGPWDAALDAVMNTADDGAVCVFVFGPEGNASGKVRYTGNAFIQDYSMEGGVSGARTWSATYKPSGAVTRDVFP
jgi:hypothetical protein